MKRTHVSVFVTALVTAAAIGGIALSRTPALAQQATATPSADATSTSEVTPTPEPTAESEATDVAPGETVTETETMATGVAEGGTITVDGVGQASATPDSAVIELGVQSRALTASVALSETNAQLASLLDALTTAGIAEDDIQTQQVSLFPVYDQPQNPTDNPELAGFNAVNIVRVRVRQVDTLGELLDAAVTAGANTVQNIQFELSDPASQLAEAREAAVTNAREKAEQLAALNGATLGAVRTIVESNQAAPVFARGDFGGGGAVPIAPGSQTVQVTVQITWLLRDAAAE